MATIQQRINIDDDENAYFAKIINELGDISQKETVSLAEAKKYLDKLLD